MGKRIMHQRPSNDPGSNGSPHLPHQPKPTCAETLGLSTKHFSIHPPPPFFLSAASNIQPHASPLSPSLSCTTQRHPRTSPLLGYRPTPTTQAPPSSSRVAAPSPCCRSAASSPRGLVPLPTRPPTDLWIWVVSASPPRPSPLRLAAARCCLGSRRRALLVPRRHRALVPLPSHHYRNWSRRGADPADGGHHALRTEPLAARLAGSGDAEQRAEVPSAGHGAAGAAARRSERRADR